MKKWFRLLRNCFRGGKFVIIDPRDSSMTLSKKLWKDVEAVTSSRGLNTNRVYVFLVVEHYGFCVDPSQFKDVEDAAFMPLQVDTVTHHIGCSLVCPTGVRICLDYGGEIDLPLIVKVKRDDKLLETGEPVWILQR